MRGKCWLSRNDSGSAKALRNFGVIPKGAIDPSHRNFFFYHSSLHGWDLVEQEGGGWVHVEEQLTSNQSLKVASINYQMLNIYTWCGLSSNNPLLLHIRSCHAMPYHTVPIPCHTMHLVNL